jgi:hypothetical protein
MLIQTESGAYLLQETHQAYRYRNELTGKIHLVCSDCFEEPEWQGEPEQECTCGRLLIVEPNPKTNPAT